MFSYKVLKYLHFSGENKVSSYEHMCDMFIWDKINSQVPPNMDRHLCFATLRDGTYFHEMHFQATSKNHMRMNKGPGPLADGQDFSDFPLQFGLEVSNYHPLNGIRGDPRTLANAASRSNAEVGTSSAQLTADKHRVCEACSPRSARSPREFSQGCTESCPRAVSLPGNQLLQMPDDSLGERTPDL